MKKSTKHILWASAIVAVLAAMCVPDMVEEAREKKAEKEEKARQERLAEQKRIDKECKEAEKTYFAHVKDSLMKAMGYDEAAVKRAEQISNSISDDKYVLFNLRDYLSYEARGTQMGLMYGEIESMVANKGAQCARELDDLLGLYGLFVRDAEYSHEKQVKILTDICDSDFNDCSCYESARTINKQMDAEEISSWANYRIGTIFGFDSEDDKFNWGEYGESRQKEIKSAAKEILIKMYRDVLSSMNQIVRQYAKYYPILSDPKDLPAEYRELLKDFELWWVHPESGDWEPGYLEGDLVVTRSIRVYDSKLPVSFFGEKNADYKLVSVGQGKWKVVRTSKDGKIAETAVFTHNVDYDYMAHAEKGGIKVGDRSFSFEPGANMGVAVYAREVVFVKKREIPNDKISDQVYAERYGKIDSKVDSLSAEIAAKDSLCSPIWKKQNSIADEAQRIAQQKLETHRADIRAAVYKQAQAKAKWSDHRHQGR